MAPLFYFLRAKRDSHWDDSNMTNMLRLFAHIVAHPSEFAHMYFPDGRKCFPYIGSDELSEVTNTRLKDNEQHF